jgi:hypothetical protein
LGPTDRAGHEAEPWERLADAVNLVLDVRAHKTTDEMRRVIEGPRGCEETVEWGSRHEMCCDSGGDLLQDSYPVRHDAGAVDEVFCYTSGPPQRSLAHEI